MNAPVRLEAEHLGALLEALKRRGYTTVGPTVRDGCIVYDEIYSTADLPVGWTDEQESATYRLKRRDNEAYFGYNAGPDSWKKFLYPSSLKLLTARKSSKGFEVRSETSGAEVPSYAFIGVRACELNAIHIQDRVFGSGQFTDPTYRARREKAFVVAVNCTQAGGTCFCVSMNTGPRVGDGFDISLTEVVRDENHFFLAAVGSGRGSEVMDELQHSAAGESDVDAAEGLVNETALHMGRELAADGMRDRLFTHIESPRWDDVAKRCLTCTNCTLVCPTCFCSTIEEVTDLGGTTAERWRRWDSCFTLDFAKVAGGNFRYSVWSRYRQWLTHKLAYWIDQFGTSGCVGCGRCITWCPAGIDITVEAQAVVGVEPQEPKGD